MFFTRLCILTKRHPRVGLGLLHPLPTCGEASAWGSGLEAKAGADSRAWMTHTFNPQVMPGPRICFSTYWTYYPSIGLHVGDRSNKYGLSFQGDFSLDVLLVAMCSVVTLIGRDWSEREGPVGVHWLPNVTSLLWWWPFYRWCSPNLRCAGLLFGALIWAMFLSFQKSWAFYSDISEQCRVWSRLSLSGTVLVYTRCC